MRSDGTIVRGLAATRTEARGWLEAVQTHGSLKPLNELVERCDLAEHSSYDALAAKVAKVAKVLKISRKPEGLREAITKRVA